MYKTHLFIYHSPMPRLTDHLNSQYLDAANRLKPKGRGRVVVAYVESYDDVWFWRSVLQEFESADVKFEVMLPIRDSALQRGKKGALASLLKGDRFGRAMIACVDADYDYLLQGRTEHSAAMLKNPYVVHTQVYAIENFQCYAEGLREACVMATLNDRELLDLAGFMHEYSLTIWPLLVWSVWAYRYDRYKEFSLTDFAQVVKMHDVDVMNPMKSLTKLKQRVNAYQNQLYHRFPDAKKTYASMKEELKRLGVKPESCYLYMQGHTLFEGAIMPLLTPVCTRLRREREQEISRMACHDKQMQNELSCYQHSVSPVEAMLKKGTFYKELPEYELVREQVRGIVERMCGSV